MKYWTEAIYGEKSAFGLVVADGFQSVTAGKSGKCGFIPGAKSRKQNSCSSHQSWKQKTARILYVCVGVVVYSTYSKSFLFQTNLSKPYLLNTSQPPKIWLYAREHTSKISACVCQLVKILNVTVATSLGQHEVQTKQDSGKVIVYV